MSSFQQTILKEVSFTGVGIHTGEKTNVVFKPESEDQGIKFVRTDLQGSPEIKADIENVTGINRGTTVGKGDVHVQTVEHLMAAACGLGIDNLTVEIDNIEVPVGDGSCREYVSHLKKAGIKKQKALRSYCRLSEPLYLRQGKSELVCIPSDEFSVSAAVQYDDDVIRSQFINIKINEKNFVSEIAPARTYCFEEEIESLKKRGLGKGGNFENTLVIGRDKVKNTELRFPDELVRHKIIDLIGDLYLLGAPLKVRVIANCCGHASNIALARKIKKNCIDENSSAMSSVIDIDELLNILPHRYPFLLVDRIELDSSKKHARGYKNITYNEPFFKGHYPKNPVFPPALLIEFIAQSSAVMFLSAPEVKNKLAFFIKIDKAEFYDDVKPLDVLTSQVELVKARERGGKVKGAAFVNGKKVAKAEFMFSLVDKK